MLFLLFVYCVLIILVVLRLLASERKHRTVPGRQYQSFPCPEREFDHFRAVDSAAEVVVMASVSLLLPSVAVKALLIFRLMDTRYPEIDGHRSGPSVLYV